MMMASLTIPYAGDLLVAHLAAYGLGSILDAYEQEAYVGHDVSLEMEPQVRTPLSVERVVELIRCSATECDEIVRADVEPGKPLDGSRPAIWARATGVERSLTASRKREELLDAVEAGSTPLPVALASGLGAPTVWLEKPSWGASRLDGVTGNATSDLVRGVLRRTLTEAAVAEASDLQPAWSKAGPRPRDDDKTGWAPRGTRVDRVHQWLAALGLSLLPVALASDRRALTPCFWREGNERGINLPILDSPVSVPRLRALLQRPELVSKVSPPAAAARLRALGVAELVSFTLVDRSTKQSVQFNFGRGERVAL